MKPLNNFCSTFIEQKSYYAFFNIVAIRFNVGPPVLDKCANFKKKKKLSGATPFLHRVLHDIIGREMLSHCLLERYKKCGNH